jgi:hypothetical protein
MPKLNDEALAIAKEFIGRRTPEGEIQLAVKEGIAIKSDYKDRAIAVAMKLRTMINAEESVSPQEYVDELKKIIDEREEKLAQLRERTKERALTAEDLHNEIIRRIREAQPELQNIEFGLNLASGMYSNEGPREVQNEEQAQEEIATEEMRKLLKRLE